MYKPLLFVFLCNPLSEYTEQPFFLGFCGFLDGIIIIAVSVAVLIHCYI